MNAEPIDCHAFRALMRNVAGQVSIVASGAPGQRSGLTASAVCSLSDLPPTVLVCVNRAAGAHDVIIENGVFTVNALAIGQEDIARVFSGMAGARGEERFETGRWSEGVTGAPVLADAVCWLECRLFDYRPSVTHTVFFGRVVAGDATLDASPLLYHRGNYTGLDPQRPDLALPPSPSAKGREGRG